MGSKFHPVLARELLPQTEHRARKTCFLFIGGYMRMISSVCCHRGMAESQDYQKQNSKKQKSIFRRAREGLGVGGDAGRVSSCAPIKSNYFKWYLFS